MLWFNIKIAIRNLIRQKVLSGIQIIGLALGMALSILIFIFVIHEYSFDSYHKNLNKIYSVIKITKDNNGKEYEALNQMPMPRMLKNELQGNDITVVSFYACGGSPIKVGEKTYDQYQGYSTEQEVFDVFSFKMLQGNPKTALNQPFSVVISKDFATKVFGTKSPIGETFKIDVLLFTITGVVDRAPSNSTIKFDMLFSEKLRYIQYPDFDRRWWHGAVLTYVMFKNSINPELVKRSLTKIKDKNLPAEFKDWFDFDIVPLKGMHLRSEIKGNGAAPISAMYLYMLIIIALAIIVIACINYINLSTCLAELRSKEIAVRAVVGSGKGRLFRQFITESLLVTFIATDLSIVIAKLLLPWFIELIGRKIDVNIGSLPVLSGTIGFALVVGLISGIYPGLFVTRFNTSKILYSRNSKGTPVVNMRKYFLVLQMIITIILVVSELFIVKQITYMKNHGLGFDNKNLLFVGLPYSISNSKERLDKARLFIAQTQQYGAKYNFGKASITENIPGFYFQNGFKVRPADKPNDDAHEMVITSIDENYFDVFGAKLIEGDGFKENEPKSYGKALINETAMKILGWKTARGKFFKFHFEDQPIEVLGVVKDINIFSLQKGVKPLIYRFQNNSFPGFVTIRIDPNKRNETIALLKAEWRKIFPDMAFYYDFVEEKYRASYGEEEHLSKIVGTFSFLSILLSIFGLFGFVSFNTQRRTKEIGVRKINGAETNEIMFLLSKNITYLITIAFVIACPFGWYAAKKWTQNFAYKTDLSWWVFAAGGLSVLIISLLIVSWHTYRASSKNPVEALRYE
jgi:putative ABC transport system permease protein